MKNFKKIFLIIVLLFGLTACEIEKESKHEILLNNQTNTEYYVGDDVDYKSFFTIKDENGNNITVEDSMIDSSNVNLNVPGTYKVTIKYNGIEKDVYIVVIEKTVTYTIEINDSLSTSIKVNETVDFKSYFTITDSNDNSIIVTDEMLDLSKLNIQVPGKYNISLSYKGVTRVLEITVIEEIITYEIIVNENLPKEFELGTENINFKQYFTIKDSKGNVITVLDSMIDALDVNYNEVGNYVVTITYQDIVKEITITIFKVEVIEDFDILFDLIKALPLNNKGTATSTKTVKIKGTVFMDVANETKLVFITDGKNFIRLYADKMHNYTTPGVVYEVTGYYKSHIYQPTFEVSTPSTDIKALRDETPITNNDLVFKEITVEEYTSLKRENFVENINNGYLQSMLKVKGFLHLDSSNSSRYDYALTNAVTYSKNNTGHINNAIYFKNPIAREYEKFSPLEEVLYDYEVDPEIENIEVELFGVFYDWNPDSKSWRLYIAEDLTIEYLTAE